MKRLNPKTNKPFRKGEARDDGWKFLGYRYDRIRKDGTYVEFWTSAENYAKRMKQEAIRKQKKLLGQGLPTTLKIKRDSIYALVVQNYDYVYFWVADIA